MRVQKGYPMNEELITVHLDEEYGYRQWKWETGMNALDLEEWWSSLLSVAPYFFCPADGLPGTLTQIPETYVITEGEWAAYERGDLSADAITALMDERNAQPKGWTGHIHQDDDSGLTSPEGRIIRHAGFERRDDAQYADEEE